MKLNKHLLCDNQHLLYKTETSPGQISIVTVKLEKELSLRRGKSRRRGRKGKGEKRKGKRKRKKGKERGEGGGKREKEGGMERRGREASSTCSPIERVMSICDTGSTSYPIERVMPIVIQAPLPPPWSNAHL